MTYSQTLKGTSRRRIYGECSADEVLARILGGFPKRSIVHELKGKAAVVSQVGQRTKTKGLVDEDPQSVQPLYLQNIRLQNALPGHGLIHRYDAKRQNHIIVLCPRLEEFVCRAARLAKVSIGDYGLPADPKKLHSVINDDIDKFSRLVNDLKQSQPLLELERLLTL